MKVRVVVLGCVLLLAAGCSGTAADKVDNTVLQGADESVPAQAEGAPTGCVTAQSLMETAAPLNLREGPSTDAPLLLVMPAGTELSAAASTSCPENGFYKVRFGGFEGWAYGAWLRSSTGSLQSALSYANTRADAIARARAGVGFSYWWGHGRFLESGSSSGTAGSCSGGCPSCSHSGSYGGDCSGLAAKVWVVPGTNDTLSVDSHPYSTFNFENEYHGWHNVSRGSLQKADAMVYNTDGAGHIFVYEKGDPWGSMYAYECKGCSDGCVYNIRTAGSSYKGIGRDNIIASTPTPVQMAKRADVNGDGRADLVSLQSDGTAFFWPGLAGGTFSNAIDSFAGTMEPALFDKNGHYPVDVADVDGNGKADLVTVSTTGHAYVYSGSASGFCCAVASFNGTLALRDESGAGHEPVAVADVTGDDNADLVTVHTNGNVYVYPGASDRTFGSAIDSFNGTFNSAQYDKEGHYVVDVADVTGDGKADLVTMHTSGTAFVYPGTASGTFGGAVASFNGTLNLSLVDGVGHEPVGVADVTGDGKADLVTLNTTGNAYVFPGSASGVFGSAVASFNQTMNTSLFDRAGHEAINVLDITGDGKADFVSAHSSGTLYVYPGTSTGAFGAGVANFAGTLNSSRFDGVGHEFVSERILSRRRGCSATGC